MFGDVIKKINKAKKIAIFNHQNPDGDAMGSAFGLKLALISMGKDAKVFLRDGDENTKEYKLLKNQPTSITSPDECDLKIAVDCADMSRLGSFVEDFCGNTAAIDHHITHKTFAQTTVVMPSAPATGEIVAELVEALGVELTHDIAYNLYMAIVCDTGNFKYSSTTPKTHIIAAKLMETGIDVADMTKRLFDTKSMRYLEMYKKGIEGLELYHQGKIALLGFTQQDFESAGLDESEADGIVNLPGSVLGVEVGVYIRERNDEFKVSLRSNGLVNVAEIADSFGGGGHEKASGFSLKKTLDEVKKIVVDTVKKAIDEVGV